MQHTCKPRSGIKGLYAVELEPHSPLGRRIWTLGPYKSSWNNGCDACLMWKVAQRLEHVIDHVEVMEYQWVDTGKAALLRHQATDKQLDWMTVAFSGTMAKIFIAEPGLKMEAIDSTKMFMTLVRAAQNYRITRITSSESWRVGIREPRYEIIKLPIEDYTEAKEVLKEAGFGNGFARASLSISQIEWQLRESFDPGIDLN